MTNKLTWEQLSEKEKQVYYRRALYLINKGYFPREHCEKLAREIMEKTSK